MKRVKFIYLTAFLCGVSVMAIELSASRLLAPTFGTSSIIWTIVIGLIMISLSIGNILGGRLADKHNSMDKLYSFIWIAAIWVALIPLLGKYVIDLIAILLIWILPNSLLIAGSSISCLIIFSLPLILLGIVPPYLVKLAVTDIKNNGKTTGQIYAVSTIGSIIGTFIPTFFTIPTIGTSKTFFVFSGILNLICLIYFIPRKIRVFRNLSSIIVIGILTFIPFGQSYAFWKDNIRYESESMYNYLQVSETDDEMILSTNVAFGIQSIYSKKKLLSGYFYDYALIAPFFRKNVSFEEPNKLLILGMGTGTVAKLYKHFYPKAHIDGVEIDQKIVQLSKKYFNLQEDEANIYINDGRTFLTTRDADKYDVIMIDAYHDITIPFHMSTKEFFKQVKSHLTKDGIIVVNINMRTTSNSEMVDYFGQTLKSVMAKVYKCSPDSNTMIYASDNVNCESDFLENASKVKNDQPLFSVTGFTKNNMQEVTESKLVLTDDLAPVEILGVKVLNEMIGLEVNDFKKRLRSSGKKDGIFNAIWSEVKSR